MILNSFIAKGSKFIAYHWRIAVLILLLLCIVGIPGTWLLVERTYVVTGAVRIASIWSPGSVQMYLQHYQKFMHAQSEMVISDQVIERVADDLTDKNLAFFEGRGGGFNAKLRWRLNYKDIRPKPTTVLKQAILDKIITAEPAIEEALIKISMRWPNSKEAIKIVDSFIRNYIIVSSPTQGGEQLAALLKKEQKKLAEKLKSQREEIKSKAQEFGSTSLDTETIDVGRLQLEIEELQEELSFTKERYHAVCRRIQELDIERMRPPLRSVAYNAHIVQVRDVRWKVTIVLVLGVVVSTILLILSNRIF